MYGQSVGDRIKSAGVVYVDKISETRFFVVIKMVTAGVPTWDSIYEAETKVGDTTLISDGLSGGVQGDLLHYKDAEAEFINLVNEGMIGVFKSRLDPSIRFVDNKEDKGDSYFLLELEGVQLIANTQYEKLSERLEFRVTLNEMAPGMKKPKKVTSVFQNGTYCEVDLPENWGKEDLDTAVADLTAIMIEKTRIDLAKMSDAAEKKLQKGLSK
jgi:hypothetical protein